MTLTRRSFVIALPSLLAATAQSARAAGITIYRNAGCGCCHKWSEAMAEAGLPVSLSDVDDMAPVHARLGVPEALQGCHAGEIDSYVIEGHVPPIDILRLLRDRPKARGLSVAGMPQGSPGMETGTNDPYQVLLFQADGQSTVFARYG